VYGGASAVLLLGMTFARHRSEIDDRSEGGAPDTHSSPAGRRRAGGEPASGEG
jgi:hypothetical protein